MNPEAQTISATNSRKNPAEITKEIRFAVVMYGGISLAIYMNGIAQELLSLVKSTANDSEQTGTAKVYRDIAIYLSNLTSARVKQPFRHKFVVDIISGTSAGGINGICLAKGLVRGVDDLKALEQTWLNEGDIDKLLNDKESQPDIYPSKEPKTALFNSQRMYAKLLDAFQKMEKGGKKGYSHVDSMDLFVTATDLRGVQRPVLLSDAKAWEHIYKHVFPFRYRQDESLQTSSENDKTQLNHFTADFDPLLAFASRCTSSIPPAFEPVKIREILDYLKEWQPGCYEIFTTNLKKWEPVFFQGYDNTPDGISLQEREFSDGGYLDNRPFGYAIDAIHARQADCPIERKLLFIDPSPEPKEGIESQKEISFVKNGLLAFNLPRYETIREELSALQKRNDWIKRVRHILDDNLENQNSEALEKLFFTPEAELANLFCEDTPGVQCEKDLKGMQRVLGRGYSAYHYTRMSLLTDQLALILAKAGMVDERPDIYCVIRYLVKRWRTAFYTSFNRDIASGSEIRTENIFFRNFDIDFRIRRLSYFRKKLEKAISEKNVSELFFGRASNESINEIAWSNDLNAAITVFYDNIVNNLRSFYQLKEQLLSCGKENPLSAGSPFFDRLIADLSTGIQMEQSSSSEPLTDFFRKYPVPETLDDISLFFSERFNRNDPSAFKREFDTLMNVVHEFIQNGNREVNHRLQGTIAASSFINDAFSELGEKYPDIAKWLRFMYDFGYDLYDATTFQLLAGGDYGEGNVVDIYRISPADSPSLWDETKKQKAKLGGNALGGFGGFLDREWRRNDIMWGRFDAAERIITALIPDPHADREEDESEYSGNLIERAEARKKYILEAQEIILGESLKEWLAELESTRFKSPKDAEQYQTLQCIKETLEKADKKCDEKGNPPWKQKFMEVYDFHREIEPEPNLKRLGRGSGILASMVDRLDSGKGMTKTISGYLKKLNWILLGMLDFSTPKTMLGVLSGYWMQLLVLVSGIMIALGTLSKINELTYFGVILLLIDLAAWMLRLSLATHIHKIKCTPQTRWLTRFVLGVVALALVVGVIFLYNTISSKWALFWHIFSNVFL